MRMLRLLIIAAGIPWALVALAVMGVYGYELATHLPRAVDDFWIFLGIMAVTAGMLAGLAHCYKHLQAMEGSLLAGILACTGIALYFVASRLWQEQVVFEARYTLLVGIVIFVGGRWGIRRQLGRRRE